MSMLAVSAVRRTANYAAMFARMLSNIVAVTLLRGADELHGEVRLNS